MLVLRSYVDLHSSVLHGFDSNDFHGIWLPIMPKVLVVGASRGLGLALVEELRSRSSISVIATVRGSIPLEGIDTLTDVDISSDDSIAAAAQHPLVKELDVIIVNAAIGAP